ncbi:MAG TPA: hypothetical protein VGA78_14620 [Gemmatimonadales bacterium]|jgi:Spy/CpxP family protein refolding chaperone
MTRAVLAAVALLILGGAIGVTADRLHHRPHGTAALWAEVQKDPVGVMQRELDLRPEQRARVAAIMEQRQGAIDAVWRDTHVRLRATIDSVVSEIAAVLDPDQAERFRRLADEIHSGPAGMHRRSH